jgi:hypothetical protein
VIDNVLDRDDSEYQSETHKKTIRSLEIRLQGLVQHHSAFSDIDLDEVGHPTKVAELFRLATLLYLFRLAKGEAATSPGTSKVISEAFTIFEHIEHCDRPWPLFIIALEARTEEQRAIILTVLKNSLKRKPLGTMSTANRMIHGAWIQQDLHEGEMDPLVLYGSIVSRTRVPPSFT